MKCRPPATRITVASNVGLRPCFTHARLRPVGGLWACAALVCGGSSELNNQEVAAQVGSKSSVRAAAMRFLGAIGNQRTVTRRTHLRVLPPERRRIEPRTMGVEPPPAQSRVAGETVTLGMAGDAALEILSRRLAVAQQERPLGIVVSRVERPFRREPGVHMTVGAKLTRVVAIAAARLPGICRGGMTREEAGRMVAGRRIGCVGPVAVETLRSDMAAAAGLRARICDGTVQLGKIIAVGSRARPVDHGALAAARAGGRQSQSQRGLGDVTSEAALLGMTRGA